MKIMFYMMNDARLNTGLQALAYSSAAYLEALAYARQRVQGRDLDDRDNREAKPVTIIHHPDVRRNLLRMKAYVSGMRSFFYYTAFCDERLELGTAEGPLEQAFFSLLTPVIKEYLAVMGYEVCNQAIQVLGGAGYTKDYPVEQLARDCRITSIYEGASGIQAMDLIARKIGSQGGAAYEKLVREIKATVSAAADIPGLESLAETLDQAVDRLAQITRIMGQRVAGEAVKTAFAHSLPYLHATGDVIMAWMLLWRAVVASEKLAGNCRKKDAAFYEGQIGTARFFIETELFITMGKLAAIEAGSSAAVDIEDEGFGGV